MNALPGVAQYQGAGARGNVIAEPFAVNTIAPDCDIAAPFLNVILVAPLTVNAIPTTLIGPIVGAATTVLSPDAAKLMTARLTLGAAINYQGTWVAPGTMPALIAKDSAELRRPRKVVFRLVSPAPLSIPDKPLFADHAPVTVFIVT